MRSSPCKGKSDLWIGRLRGLIQSNVVDGTNMNSLPVKKQRLDLVDLSSEAGMLSSETGEWVNVSLVLFVLNKTSVRSGTGWGESCVRVCVCVDHVHVFLFKESFRVSWTAYFPTRTSSSATATCRACLPTLSSYPTHRSSICRRTCHTLSQPQPLLTPQA